jgi:hypothetical protein
MLKTSRGTAPKLEDPVPLIFETALDVVMR